MIDLNQFTYFHFLRPWWLLVFIPLVLTLWYLRTVQSPVGKWRKAIAPHLLKVLLIRHGRANWFNPVNVSLLSIILGVLALAGPSWEQYPSPFSEDISPLVIVLDVSPSMQQQDIQPNRLERAKQKVQDLQELRAGGRVGLIVFSGSAHSVIPLTNDPDVVKNFLNAVVPEMMPRRGKFPEKALPIADRMLRDSPVPGTILLIGDGISTQTATAFKAYFSEQYHQLLVFGIGRESFEGRDESFIPLERSSLEKLASESGGFYQSLTLDTTDVERIIRRVNNHLVIVDDSTHLWIDAGYYLLYPFALILLLWFRKGWTLHWCIALGLVTSLSFPLPATANGALFDQWRFMDLWLTPDQQGKYYLNTGDYKTAADRFENIAWKGIAYYRGENFESAAEMFSRIETVDGYFNLGNAWAHSRNYLLAVSAYDNALELDPVHKESLKNRKLIQAIIDSINLLSESQRAEQGEASQQMGDDDPQTAEGADRVKYAKRELEQLTAEQVLLDESMNEIWMRQVQRDPSRFLSVKFHMQLQDGEE